MSSRTPHGRTEPRGDEAAERNVNLIATVERAALHQRTRADRFSDALTSITGSVPFATAHVLCFAGWIVFNAGLLDGIEPFDPFPFGLLTLIVSLEAIFLSVFVLMSQNRIVRHSDRRAHLDLQVDLLAEQELTTILHMLRALCAKLGVSVDIPEDRLRALSKDTDVPQLWTSLNDKLPRQ